MATHVRPRRPRQPAGDEVVKETPADELRRLISERTGINSRELVCPRESSFMTPCVARDGQLAVALTFGDREICAGCTLHVSILLERERLTNPPEKKP